MANSNGRILGSFATAIGNVAGFCCIFYVYYSRFPRLTQNEFALTLSSFIFGAFLITLLISRKKLLAASVANCLSWSLLLLFVPPDAPPEGTPTESINSSVFDMLYNRSYIANLAAQQEYCNCESCVAIARDKLAVHFLRTAFPAYCVLVSVAGLIAGLALDYAMHLVRRYVDRSTSSRESHAPSER